MFVLSFSFPTQDLFIFPFAWLPFQLLIWHSLPASCIPTILLGGCITVWISVSTLASAKLSWIFLCGPQYLKVTSSQTQVLFASDLGRFCCCAEQDMAFTLFWCMDLSPVWISSLCREVVVRALADSVECVWSLFRAVMSGTGTSLERC